MRDLYDNPIEVGRWVSYPWRRGSSLGMTHGLVDGFGSTTSYRRTHPTLKLVTAGGRSVTITRVDCVVQAPKGWAPPIPSSQE